MCSQILRDLDQDVWKITFRLNLFQPTLVKFTRSLAEAAPEGWGVQVLDHPVISKCLIFQKAFDQIFKGSSVKFD